MFSFHNLRGVQVVFTFNTPNNVGLNLRFICNSNKCFLPFELHSFYFKIILMNKLHVMLICQSYIKNHGASFTFKNVKNKQKRLLFIFTFLHLADAFIQGYPFLIRMYKKIIMNIS